MRHSGKIKPCRSNNRSRTPRPNEAQRWGLHLACRVEGSLLLMSGIWIRSLRVDALIAGRRRGDDALMLDLRRGGPVPVVSPRRVVALGNGLFRCIGRRDRKDQVRTQGTVTVTHWPGTDGPYSLRLWTSFHTAATAFRASSSGRPSGSISASL